MKTVEIWSEYITLGQLLKLLDYVGSGAEVKGYLAEYDALINNERDNRRGRKIRPGDIVEMPDGKKYKVEAKS
jgi:ribosome-associated protein YbcJ (S4-like RNA binding protein)